MRWLREKGLSYGQRRQILLVSDDQGPIWILVLPSQSE